jgi:hypothetical protein
MVWQVHLNNITMKKNKCLNVLSLEECKEINGGTFAWDLGWFIGNSIAGNFLTFPGTAEALADYAIHYYVE